jgi:hypothetical protein
MLFYWFKKRLKVINFAKGNDKKLQSQASAPTNRKIVYFETFSVNFKSK